MMRINKGLDLPISGSPEQKIEAGPQIQTVALIGDDYLGLKPTMAVSVGERVKLGQLLFTDKRTPGVRYTAPGCGEVVAIHRGAKRKFESLLIRLEGDEEEAFPSYPEDNFAQLERHLVRDNLLASGLWTALRTRPWSKVALPSSVPHSIFITAMDTNPLAASVELILDAQRDDFRRGVALLTRLTDGDVFLCKAPGGEIPGGDLPGVKVEEFAGPHPAGLAGTHIHFLDPVGPRKTVWYVNYQDVIAMGRLFMTGRLPVERTISLAGPVVERPRLLTTRLGASIDELVEGEAPADGSRFISGSVLSGRQATEPVNYLGRYHLQVSALAEGTERVLLGWHRPGFDKFSVKRVFASVLTGRKKFPLTTSTEGSPRAMVPVGSYEQVMPLDVVATYLLRALIIGDTHQAQALGCLELDEEDLALCTYVCPSKYEYGALLRKNLTQIERDG